MHLNQSLKTDGRYPNSAPDFGGAIEVDNEGNVNGWDYLWVRYADKVAEGGRGGASFAKKARRPRFARECK